VKILQVGSGIPPKSIGGAERYIKMLSEEMSKRHEVAVLYPTYKNTSKVDIIKRPMDNLLIYEILLPKKFFWNAVSIEKTYKNEKIDGVLKKILRDFSPDIIHMHRLAEFRSVGIINMAATLNIPTVITLHDYWFICSVSTLVDYRGKLCKQPEALKCYTCRKKKISQEMKLKTPGLSYISELFIETIIRIVNSPNDFEKRNKYLLSLLLKVDKLITPSKFLKEVFVEYGVPENKIVHSENGYNLDVFRGFEKKKKDTEKIIFGFTGSIIPIKGVHILIDAFLNVPEDQAELRIYGTYNPESSYVRKLFLKIQGKSNISFFGRYNDPKVPFSEIDVLIFPSISYENCPLVLAEARATKTPVIASNLGAIPEFVEDGKNGLLFDPNNPKDLYEKMIQIIQNPELLEKFKSNITSPRSIEEQAKEIENIYTYLKEIKSSTNGRSI